MTYLSILFSLSNPPEMGLASRYGYPGDQYENFKQPYACHGSLTKKWGKERYEEALKTGVAHRTLPCGTKVLICKTKKASLSTHDKSVIWPCTSAIVVDRGPYGTLNQQGLWHRRSKLQPGERWRGIVDLLPPVAAKLGVRGLEKVVIWY